MMDDTFKEKLASVLQATLMVGLVVTILLSPVRTQTVLAVEEPVTYVEITEDQMTFGQDVVQDDLHKRLGL
jgi:hypothetical protein